MFQLQKRDQAWSKRVVKTSVDRKWALVLTTIQMKDAGKKQTSLTTRVSWTCFWRSQSVARPRKAKRSQTRSSCQSRRTGAFTKQGKFATKMNVALKKAAEVLMPTKADTVNEIEMNQRYLDEVGEAPLATARTRQRQWKQRRHNSGHSTTVASPRGSGITVGLETGKERAKAQNTLLEKEVCPSLHKKVISHLGCLISTLQQNHD